MPHTKTFDVETSALWHARYTQLPMVGLIRYETQKSGSACTPARSVLVMLRLKALHKKLRLSTTLWRVRTPQS